MLIEIERDALHFQAISRTGETIDAGTLYKDARHAPPEASSGPYRLKEYQSQPASDHDSPAATTERPVVIHEAHTTKRQDTAALR
jgi:hypothetical protein